MPDHAAAHKKVVLPALARIRQGKVGFARPEVAHLAAKAEAAETVQKGIHVQSQAALDHARARRTRRVRAVVDEFLIFAKVAETAAEAHPGRNCGTGEEIQPYRGRHENLLVIDGNYRAAGVQVFIQMENRGHLSRE